MMSNSFADVVRNLASGDVYEELSGKLAEIVAAVQETGKVGSLRLDLKVRSSGDGATVTIEDRIVATIPVPLRPTTIFFTTGEGGLLRSDPRQRDLPLREVGRPETAVQGVA